jgi:hypothetical protein
MWESETTETVAPPPTVEHGPPPPAPRSPWPTATAMVGSGAAFGVVRTAAPLLTVAAALEGSHASVTWGALWVPPEAIALGPGVVDVQLVSADLRGCITTGRRTRLGLCLGGFVGALLAQGQGYSADRQRVRPWLSADGRVFVGGLVPLLAPLRYELAADVVAPLHQEQFSISGYGIAYTPPPVGALVTLSVGVGPQPH